MTKKLFGTDPVSYKEAPIIFLDIDGVLNRHGIDKFENMYSRLNPACVAPFNRVLAAVPTAKIVLSSAWRYHVLNGSMNLKGLEVLLMTHGVNCFDRLLGITESDAAIAGQGRNWDYLKEHGHFIRKQQIDRWLFGMRDPDIHTCVNYVIIDDIDLRMYRQIITDYDMGFEEKHVEQTIAWLTGDSK